MAGASHLIGAYGMFWERNEIDWDAGRGQTFQLLGARGVNRQKLEVCDFRRARGIYILFNNHGPTYVGRARGSEGLGSRLKNHDGDTYKDWVRFCWFSFDSVLPLDNEPHWRTVTKDEDDRAIGASGAIDELEALMITAFGLGGSQNVMKLPTAREPWVQLTYGDFLPSGVGRKFDPNRVRMQSLREALGWSV